MANTDLLLWTVSLTGKLMRVSRSRLRNTSPPSREKKKKI